MLRFLSFTIFYLIMIKSKYNLISILMFNILLMLYINLINNRRFNFLLRTFFMLLLGMIFITNWDKSWFNLLM